MADCIVEYAFSQYSLPFNPHPCKVLPSDQVIRLAVGEGEGGSQWRGGNLEHQHATFRRIEPMDFPERLARFGVLGNGSFSPFKRSGSGRHECRKFRAEVPF